MIDEKQEPAFLLVAKDDEQRSDCEQVAEIYSACQFKIGVWCWKQNSVVEQLEGFWADAVHFGAEKSWRRKSKEAEEMKICIDYETVIVLSIQFWKCELYTLWMPTVDSE